MIVRQQSKKGTVYFDAKDAKKVLRAKYEIPEPMRALSAVLQRNGRLSELSDRERMLLIAKGILEYRPRAGTSCMTDLKLCFKSQGMAEFLRVNPMKLDKYGKVSVAPVSGVRLQSAAETATSLFEEEAAEVG